MNFFTVDYFNTRLWLSLGLIAVAVILVLILSGNIRIGEHLVKQKANKEASAIKKRVKQEKVLIKVLSFCERFDAWFLLPVNLDKIDLFNYAMRRFNFQLPFLMRAPTAEEFSGACKLVGLFFSIIGVSLFVYTLNPIFLMLLVFLFLSNLLLMCLNLVLDKSDEALDKDFPDLYLFLCPSLLRGSDCHLLKVLDEYVVVYSLYSKEHKDILSFVNCMRRLIIIHGSELVAVKNLRDYYRTPCVVNFINLAIQSLNGIDNSQRLLAYKEELCQKNLEVMKAKGEKLCAQGSKVILLIFIILAQFVVLSWLSKCGFTLPAKWLM